MLTSNNYRNLAEVWSIDLELEQPIRDSVTLWELTTKALPALINLEHLCFRPQSLRFGHTIHAALRQCKFKLRSLSWGCSTRNSNFQEFLLTQNSLLHLDLGTSGQWKGGLSKDHQTFCPSLISITCMSPTLPYVSKTWNIIGYRMTESWPLLQSSDILLDSASAARLKYLSVPRYTVHSAFSTIIILEVRNWDKEVRCNKFNFLRCIMDCLYKLTRPFRNRPSKASPVSQNYVLWLYVLDQGWVVTK
jgi:hypothetical protein